MVGYDVIIVATNLPYHEEYWQKRLKGMEGVLYKKGATVITVSEDSFRSQPECREDELSALYAYHKAQEKGKFKYRLNIFDMQQQGAAVALFLATGARQDLFPLIASEQNNLGALQLPGMIQNNRLTLLEALLMQTALLAKDRGGRLSIFNCDQLFIPAKPYPLPPKEHLEIFCTSEKKGAPLSSFSLSSPLTFALLREFEKELEDKKCGIHSQWHLWAPLTLDQNVYQSHIPSKSAQKHYRRIQRFKEKFFHFHSPSQLISHAHIGKGSFICNYGTAKAYYETTLKLTSPSTEGQLMRLLYQTSEEKRGNVRAILDENSCLVDCQIRSGRITNSVLIGVQAEMIEAKNCVIIDSRFSTLKAVNSLLYHIEEKNPLKLAPGTIRADADFFEEETLKGPEKRKKRIQIYSHLERNGKKDWSIIYPSNSHSFEEIFFRIQSQPIKLSHNSFIA